ncbi:hypothetical protein [Salsuginibacillus kocurii]|uniref:hypothetical protein n=1 Tax=Salsuginibacillus kocurii TaxID=427078 RepID=UPI00036883D4|nr:hypothetical protein [Salsuginibacillus kocurii]
MARIRPASSLRANRISSSYVHRMTQPGQVSRVEPIAPTQRTREVDQHPSHHEAASYALLDTKLKQLIQQFKTFYNHPERVNYTLEQINSNNKKKKKVIVETEELLRKYNEVIKTIQAIDKQDGTTFAERLHTIYKQYETTFADYGIYATPNYVLKLEGDRFLRKLKADEHANQTLFTTWRQAILREYRALVQLQTSLHHYDERNDMPVKGLLFEAQS